MRKIIAVAAMALFVAACGGLSPSAQSDVYSAKTAYGAALTLAVAYNKLPRCGAPTSSPLCSDQAAVLQLRKADSVAALALDQAEAVVRNPASSSSLIAAAVQSATGAVKVLQQVETTYGLK